MTAGEVIQDTLCDKHCQCVPHWHVTQCESKAAAILAALRGAGFAVVPREATRAMLNCGLEGADIDWRAASADGALSDDEVIRIYRAMVAAAEPREGCE